MKSNRPSLNAPAAAARTIFDPIPKYRRSSSIHISNTRLFPASPNFDINTLNCRSQQPVSITVRRSGPLLMSSVVPGGNRSALRRSSSSGRVLLYKVPGAVSPVEAEGGDMTRTVNCESLRGV